MMTHDVDPPRKQRRTASGFLDEQPASFVLPVMREDVAVGVRRRETGRVRIRKIPRQNWPVVEETLARANWTIERVPADHRADCPPSPRWERDTLVLPVVAEVLVKELRLVADLRITRRQTVERTRQRVRLRREEIMVERTTDPKPPKRNART